MFNKLFVFALTVSTFGCLPVYDPGPGTGCTSDESCKGERICEFGECVDDSEQSGSYTTGSGVDPSDGSCGSVQIECNCEYVQASDGQLFQTSVCDSGYVVVTTNGCPMSCYGGTATGWQAVCAC